MCMHWIMVGRPTFCRRGAGRRQRSYDARYGVGKWRFRHRIAGVSHGFVEAAHHVELSYLAFFRKEPELLDWMCATAREVVQFATSNVRSGLDYAVQERKHAHVYDIAVRR